MNEWISVKTKMPEERNEVLCCDYHDTFLAIFEGGIFWEYGRDAVELTTINFWMPLPSPPKDLNEEK